MFKKLSTSYSLVKVSFKYIKKDWELLIYSILSLISALLILATFTWIDFLYFGNIEAIINGAELDSTTSDVLIYVYIFLYYLIFSFITFFFNTAIITSVQRRINWEDNKIWDWLRDAKKHIKQIFIWSFINATISTLLNILQNLFWEK